MNILIAASFVGLSIFLLIWNFYHMFSVLPSEDRSHLDRPPKGFWMAWPLVRFGVYWSAPLLSRGYRINTLAKLRRAGHDFSLGPEQFFAGKLVAALIGLLFGFSLQQMLGQPIPAILLVCALVGFAYPDIWLKETIQTREKRIFRDLPYYLDIITLSVESGTNLITAFSYSVQKSPASPLRDEFKRVLRDIRAGKPRSECLREFADRVQMPAIDNLVSSLIQAEKVGSSLGPILRAQAEQRRNERFLKAEKLAMEAPVKLLGPLVMFIFPTTFIVLGFVLIVKAATSGVLNIPMLSWALNWPG